MSEDYTEDLGESDENQAVFQGPRSLQRLGRDLPEEGASCREDREEENQESVVDLS